MIVTKGLTKRFGEFTAVDNVSLNIQPGEIYAFLGPNGSGKTTTIMMLLGILPPTSGEIYLFGELFAPDRLDLKKRIGMVPENHPRGVWSCVTAYEYLKYFSDLYEVGNSNGRIDELLRKVDLHAQKFKRIQVFSRGMLQRLSIARALLHDPDILFLDEPISGLDPKGIRQIRDLVVGEKRTGRTIFISSHMLSEMEKICDRVGIIYMGVLRAEGRMNEIAVNVSGTRDIRIMMDEACSDLMDKLRSLPYIMGCRQDENDIVVTVPQDGDFRKEIARFLLEKDVIPIGISYRQASLEETFLTITDSNVGKLLPPGVSHV